MQFSEHWLRQFVNPKLDADALGHALTMAGLEVEEQELVAQPFNHVVIGEIVEAVKHPDAIVCNCVKLTWVRQSPCKLYVVHQMLVSG